jgi:hypothetical protein
MKRIFKTLGSSAFKLIAKGESLFDKSFLVQDVPLSKLVSHQKWSKVPVRNRKQGRIARLRDWK